MSSADDPRGGHAADGVLVQAPAGEGGDQGATGSTGSTAVGAVVATKGTADRVRLWKDSKAWLDGICKRLQISEVEAAECANIKDTQTFKSWHATGQPSHVTRLLRVWVKSVLRAAQIAADAHPAGIADGRGVAADAGDGGDEEVEIVGVKRKRGQCKACAGMHRPHTCGKVGSASAGVEGEANAPKLNQGTNAQRGGEATTAGDSCQLQERHASDTSQSVEYWARGAPQVLRLSLPHHRLLLLLFAVKSAIATLWHDRTSAPSHATPCDDNVRLYCADFAEMMPRA